MPRPLLRLAALSATLTAALALTAGGAAAAVPGPPVTPQPGCIIDPVYRSYNLTSPGVWTKARECQWLAGYSATAAASAEYRLSSDGGASWSAPATAESVPQISGSYDPDQRGARVRTDLEGRIAVQFRLVGHGGGRGPWAGAGTLLLDVSAPSVPDLVGTGDQWQPDGESVRLRISSSDAGSGVASVRYREVGPAHPREEQCNLVLRSFNGGPFEWVKVQPDMWCLWSEDSGRTTAAVRGWTGDTQVVAQACDRVLNCSDWSSAPTRFRVSQAGGPGRAFLGGTRGLSLSDLIRGGRGSERISGYAGDDLLYGGAGDDRIKGGPGADLLAGGPGRDQLVGGPGRDRLIGGPGADRINAADGRGGDRIRCGPGRDLVRADAGDRVARDCERVIRRRR